MNQVPMPPPERGLPRHGRQREELLRMLEDNRNGVSLRRRWGLPLGVAAVVSATGVLAALAFSGGAADKTGAGVGPGSSGGPTAPGLATTPARSGEVVVTAPFGTTTYPGSTPDLMEACKIALDKAKGITPIVTGATPRPIDPGYCDVAQPSHSSGPQVEPTSPVIEANAQKPMTEAEAQAVLKACVGANRAASFQIAIAQHTAITTRNEDSIVIAYNAAGEYQVCEAAGSKVQPPDSPALHKLGSTVAGNHYLGEIDSGTDSATADGTQTLLFNYGMVDPEVAKVTITYGTETQEHDAIVSGGAYELTVATPFNPDYTHPVVGYVHAYDKNGNKLYDTPVSMK